MNTETGELKYYDTNEALREAMKNEPLIPAKAADFTPKQKKDMRVSKHDNKSKLGKTFTTARAKRKWMARQIKKQSQPVGA